MRKNEHRVLTEDVKFLASEDRTGPGGESDSSCVRCCGRARMRPDLIGRFGQTVDHAVVRNDQLDVTCLKSGRRVTHAAWHPSWRICFSVDWGL